VRKSASHAGVYAGGSSDAGTTTASASAIPRMRGAAPVFQRAASRGSCGASFSLPPIFQRRNSDYFHMDSLPLHHPCTQPCHAPSSCDESAPCTAVITVTCPCGRIRQPVQCGKSVATPAGRENQQPKCSNECLIAKRNARLADALGISQESRERGPAVVWPDEVLAFGRANPKFVSVVEKAFAECV
jgi:hypothetical protein